MVANDTLARAGAAIEARRSLRAVAAALAMLLLAGCYEIENEVIGPNEGQYVAGLEGSYNSLDGEGGTTEITLLPGNEYHYREISADGSIDSGVLRIIYMWGDVYLVQSRDSEGVLVGFYYFRQTDDGGYQWGPQDVNRDTVPALAAAYGVEIFSDWGDYVSGPTQSVRAFLLAHGPEHLYSRPRP